MKILQLSEESFPEPSKPVPSPAAAPAPVSAPAPDLGRVDALEDIAKTILQKIHAIEERIEALEERPKAEALSATLQALNSPVASQPAEQSAPQSDSKDLAPATPPADAGPVAPRPSDAPVIINTDAMNKDLFSKMWKVLNNKAA